jgi:hypothetical protein
VAAPATSSLSKLRALSSPTSVTVAELAQHEALLEAWRQAVRQALANRHLVTVASELATLFHGDMESLAVLGVPVDLLDCFPRWRAGLSEPFEPPAGRMRLVPSGAAVPIGMLRLQLSPTPGSIPYALLLLRDLLRTLDANTSFVVVVEPGANVDELARLAARFHPDAPTRVRFVQLACISVFAQDNAKAARDRSGHPLLLVPRAFRRGSLRAEDELDPIQAQHAFQVEVRHSQLYWEGGNIIHDERRSFVGADTIAENVARLGLDASQVTAIFESEFGVPVTALGRLHDARFNTSDERQTCSGQASFHIDLDVSLLGTLPRASRPRALVADAARGLDFVGDVLAVRRLVAGHFLPPVQLARHLRAEYEASAAARHPLLIEYAETLATHGYRIFGVPDLRIDPAMDIFQRVSLDFGYCNVLPGLQKNRPSVAHFVSGVRALDADASRCIRRAGVTPIAVSSPEVASALRLLQGGLHCCCGPI